jgi:hypothetical protein
MAANTTDYAITVSRKDGKFLFFKIRRQPTGDIYFNIPKLLGGPKEWRPHISVHESGTVHHKDFGRKSMTRQISKPDASFSGTENVTCLGMNPEQWRNIKKPYPNQFVDIFEIDVEKLLLDTRRTQLQLDLVAPNIQPNLILGASILQRAFFRDAVPWIALTLIDTTSLFPAEKIS